MTFCIANLRSAFIFITKKLGIVIDDNEYRWRYRDQSFLTINVIAIS